MEQAGLGDLLFHRAQNPSNPVLTRRTRDDTLKLNASARMKLLWSGRTQQVLRNSSATDETVVKLLDIPTAACADPVFQASERRCGCFSWLLQAFPKPGRRSLFFYV